MQAKIALLASVLVLWTAGHVQAAAPGRGKGVVFPVSCGSAAQQSFNDALAALHSFWYAQALKEFTAIADSEPDCAMAYWGIALSRWNQIWAPPRQDALQAGAAAINSAVAAGAKTEREMDYISAALAFYSDTEKLDHRTRAGAYAAAIEGIYQKYPDDREAAAFYALSLLATADPLDASYARQKQAGQVLEAIFAQEPDHPAAAHYLIHAYDCGPLAERARPAALQYAKSTFIVPHAIHMPSHTYVLLGMWREAIDANLIGEKAELDRGIPEDRLHDIDYLVYAYLQVGQADKAKEYVDLAMAIDRDLMAAKRDVGLRARPFTIAAVAARYALERGSWQEAAALEVRSNDRNPFIEAVPHFGRAVGKARGGQSEGAKEDLQKLVALQQSVLKANGPYWARQVEIQHKIASGWAADAEGKSADAAALMAAAVELEDRGDTHDTLSPGPIGTTAHEALGEVLLKSGKASEALAQFEESLRLSKNRARGYYGAAKSASLAGNAASFTQHVQKLAALCGLPGGSIPSNLDVKDPELKGLPCAWLAGR
jgi:NAD(P)-dependent dehydrogenase (short-subunit alcohol dehydrogenase family)